MFCKLQRRTFTKSTAALNTYIKSTTALKPATLPDLPYAYDALEPTISKEIMEIHHSKHHNAYVTNYNLLLPQLQEAEKNGTDMALGGLEFNLGGHINHDIFLDKSGTGRTRRWRCSIRFLG